MLKEPTVTMFDALDDICGKSIEELVELVKLNVPGEHNKYDVLLTSENFPIPPANEKNGKHIPMLLHYDYDTCTSVRPSKVVIDIKARGFDFPTEHEGLAFAAKYPNEIPKRTNIYVIGKGYWTKATRRQGPRYGILCMSSWSHVRIFQLSRWDDNNSLSHIFCCSFLVFKQVPK